MTVFLTKPDVLLPLDLAVFPSALGKKQSTVNKDPASPLESMEIHLQNGVVESYAIEIHATSPGLSD